MNETESSVEFTGEITGSGGYVVAAWGISLGILLAYVLFTTMRLSKARAARGTS